MPFIVNHVMSQDIHSGIFEDILQRFEAYSHPGVKHVKSVRPIEGAHVRHYHRPHLESKLINPCVVTVHHDLNDHDGWLSLQTCIDRYREADLVVCLNSIQQRQLVSHGVAHTIVIPHGYDDALVATARALGRIKNSKFTIGIVSKRYPRKVKGEAYLLELAKRLDSYAIGFLLIGDGRAEEGACLRNLGFSVEVFERLPYPVLMDAYREIDALLMTSTYEGGPANIPEACGMGVPVIANPIGMVPDLVWEGHQGIYLRMDPMIDADMINRLAVDDNEAYRRLFATAQSCSNPNLITWKESVSRNVASHVRLLSDSVNELQTLVEAFQ